MTSLDTIKIAVEGEEELVEDVRGLIIIYKSCLYNRNIRPTSHSEGVDEKGERIIRSYEEAKIKPEERLEVMMQRFYKLREKLIVAKRKDLVSELDDFAVNFESVCLRDLDIYWKGKGRERYKRYVDKIQLGEKDARF